MCLKNMTTWKKKATFNDLVSLSMILVYFVKQCCRIVWSVKKNNIKTESKNPKFVKKKHGRIMLLSKCEVRDSKKSKFIEE